MQSKNGLVVNEFEELEACHYFKIFNDEFHSTVFLEEFWFQRIQCLVYEHIMLCNSETVYRCPSANEL